MDVGVRELEAHLSDHLDRAADGEQGAGGAGNGYQVRPTGQLTPVPPSPQ